MKLKDIEDNGLFTWWTLVNKNGNKITSYENKNNEYSSYVGRKETDKEICSSGAEYGGDSFKGRQISGRAFGRRAAESCYSQSHREQAEDTDCGRAYRKSRSRYCVGDNAAAGSDKHARDDDCDGYSCQGYRGQDGQTRYCN